MIIFGAGGQLGFALKEIFPEAHALSHDVVDIADESAVEALFEQFRPQVVLNAAAYPHAEKAELEDTLEAYRVNACGAIVLARLAAKYKAVLVHVSTDYVFDGASRAGCVETDTPHPLNVHGLSKLAGEDAIRAYAPLHYILRTSALFGPRQGTVGNNFVTKRLLQAQRGEEIGVVNDQWTTPTYTFDVAHAVRELLEKKAPYGTYHAVNEGGGVTWHEFTEAICREGGYDNTVVHAISSETSASLLRRPKYSVLQNTKLPTLGIVMPHWKDALSEYIKKYVKDM
jgi:dTDP-4-dehydrorhamnose reductase